MIWLLLALLTADPKLTEDPVPPVCIGATFTSWEACAAVATEGTALYSLAMMNLGTQAYQQGDRAAALRYYDKAEMPGRSFTGDVVFHTFRADARRFGGRMDDARADARIVWGFLDGRPPTGIPADALVPLNAEMMNVVLGLILPIMKDDDPAAFRHARSLYLSLPASDWLSLSLRADALGKLGEHEAAVVASKAALDLQPEDPMSLNNYCFTLVEAGRAADGLAYCESAVRLAPEAAPVRHSYATALARLGQCEASAAQAAEARRIEPEGAECQEAITCTPKP